MPCYGYSVPPDVNRGRFHFSVDDDGSVVYGLGAIKGLGEGPVQSDSREEGGPFKIYLVLCSCRWAQG